MYITKVKKSNKLFKKFQVILDDGKKFDFGLKGSRTFLNDRTIDERNNYRARHLKNKNEKYLIDNLIPSPALFSYYLLWGETRDMDKNINHLNKLFNHADTP